MRILYWTDGFWPYVGGIEVRGSNLVSTLRARGHDCVVVAAHLGLPLPDTDRFGDVTVHRFAFWNALQPEGTALRLRIHQAIVRIKREFRPHVVHIDCVAAGALFHLLTARTAPAPVLVTMQQRILSPGELGSDSILRRTLAAADRITFCSFAKREEVRRRIPDLRVPEEVVPNGVEAPSLAPSPLPRDPPRLLCVGRLVSCKGFDVAIRAFVAVARAIPGATLTIAGDGPLRSELEELARALGVSGCVSFRGWVAPSGVPELMNGCSALLVPSREEAFGLVAVEAALMARPVIASRVGGLAEVVAEGETGHLVEPGDPDALAARTLALLRSPEAAAALGRAARERALKEFTWTRHVDAYEGLYRELAKEV